jgi:F420-non-reducing hydrogenase iron-sulfur subunit
MHARRKALALRQLLTFVGIDPARFRVSWVSASEGQKWAEVVSEVTRDLRAAGPFRIHDHEL